MGPQSVIDKSLYPIGSVWLWGKHKIIIIGYTTSGKRVNIAPINKPGRVLASVSIRDLRPSVE